MAAKSKKKIKKKAGSAIGDRIRRMREEAGLTREEFAELTGVPVNTLVGYESRGKDPSGSNLEKIATAFKKDAAFLLLGRR